MIPLIFPTISTCTLFVAFVAEQTELSATVTLSITGLGLTVIVIGFDGIPSHPLALGMIIIVIVPTFSGFVNVAIWLILVSSPLVVVL